MKLTLLSGLFIVFGLLFTAQTMPLKKIVFCLNHFTVKDQEKSVKCNLIFPQGAQVEKRTASKSFFEGEA